MALEPRDEAAVLRVEGRHQEVVVAEVEDVGGAASIGMALAGVMSLTRRDVTTKLTGSAASGSSTTCSLAPQPCSLLPAQPCACAVRGKWWRRSGAPPRARPRTPRGLARAASRTGHRTHRPAGSRWPQPGSSAWVPTRQVIEASTLTGQGRLHLAQAGGARQLRMQQGDELAFAAQLAHAPIRAVLLHSASKRDQGMNCKSACRSVL